MGILEELSPSEKVKWLLGEKGLDENSEKSMQYAADIISKEVEKYEKISKERSIQFMHKEVSENTSTKATANETNDRNENLVQEVKSALLLQSMYNLERKYEQEYRQNTGDSSG
jgi:hypothetical protein